jgi:hypothetical protein
MTSILDVAFAFKGLELKGWTEDTNIDVSWSGILTDLLYDTIDLFANVSSRLLCWFQRDPEIWDILYECPAVGELVDACITGLEDVERFIFSKLDGVLDELAKEERAITIKAGFTEELKKMRQMFIKMDYVKRSATGLVGSIEELSDIKIDSHVFEDAAKRIKLTMKDKSDSLRDFVKDPFKESGFLSTSPMAISQHFDVPTVPFSGNCSLRPGAKFDPSDPDNLAINRKMRAENFPNTMGQVQGLATDIQEFKSTTEIFDVGE